MEYPWTTTIFMALMFYGAITLFFSRPGKDLLWEMFQQYPELALWTPAGLFAWYLYYCSRTGGVHWGTAWVVLAYLTIPSLFLYKAHHAWKKQYRPTLWDAAAILCLWLPFDLHLVTRRPNAIKDALDWPIIALSGVIIGLVFWVGGRQMENAKTNFRMSLRDLGITVGALLGLAAVVIPLGSAIGFLNPREFWSEELPNSSVVKILWAYLVTWKFLVYSLKIFVTIGLSEEFLFRGIIQNLLDNTLKNKVASLLVASLLFGSAHLNNGATSLYPYGWNWDYALMASIAGLAYVLVFRYTKSLLCPMLLHTLVDAIWHTLFK